MAFPTGRDHSEVKSGYMVNGHPTFNDGNPYKGVYTQLGGGFIFFLIFTPTWGNDPI